ncbi:MAG: hypothetical protein AVDCRST_MAG69-1118 [uncultured Solirubrobacteraceae bacterium]|uniref:Uncharacterized protein n=1 Tax=uncultured Solirubrobacteraceae bacterium TaxID=1162706 RepID=A0A6J4SAD3_9ACTN|nr:MAG: hypothetical protein AVDCRST_MAG69-1118 [uncultured Solirubrobacteraceae bacterium]
MPDPLPTGNDSDALVPARGLNLAGLLAELERLDGVEEADVVRAALAGGVPEEVVLEELRREVGRRLARTDAFYDQTQW